MVWISARVSSCSRPVSSVNTCRGKPAVNMACVSTMSSAPKEDASTASGCPAAICAKLSCNAAHRLETVDGGIEKETALMACSCLCTTGNKEHSLTGRRALWNDLRSEEHTSELQSLMRNSYAVF